MCFIWPPLAFTSGEPLNDTSESEEGSRQMRNNVNETLIHVPRL